MFKHKKVLISLCISAYLAISAFQISNIQRTFFKPEIPSNFPPPVYDLKANPLTEEGIELGRTLFYDPILSSDGSTSCGSCHQQFAAFAHQDHPMSHGVDNQFGRRNALPLFNLLFSKTFFWDGGVHSLDFSPLNALENEVELNEQLDNVLKKLNDSEEYRDKFKKAFGVSEITSKVFLQSLTQFMATLVSANSRYDKFIRNEGGLLTAEEKEGLELFEQKCSSCHATGLFTDGSFRNNGVPNNYRFDKGREEITLNASDRGKYKVPSLRNIEFTAPYMHDGSISSLEKVLDHYTSGVEQSATLDPLLKQNNQPGLAITDPEKKKIIAFLMTLSDREFITDKRFSEPELFLNTPKPNEKNHSHPNNR